jgi:hypothetical protein
MNPGHAYEFAIWLTGLESPERIEAERDAMLVAFDRIAERDGVLLTPATFKELRPGEDRVPPVPKHIGGPNVRLLYAEAEVVGQAPMLVVNSFLGDLDPVDLERLRTITRRTARGYGQAAMTDEECDRMIEEIGPDAAMEAVRNAVDSRAVH